MLLHDITPIILTANCEHNIAACLSDLDFAARIVVIDSGSSDATLAICGANPRVEVIHRTFDHHAAQRSFGLAQVQSGWAICLDSDYRMSQALRDELAALPSDDANVGYMIDYAYCIFGKPLRASLMPARLMLARAGRLSVVSDGHAERFSVDGPVGQLKAKMQHDDRKPLERWVSRQVFYARMEAKKLCNPNAKLRWQDRLRARASVAPFFVFGYLLIGRGLWRDGWNGWYYTVERTIAEFVLLLCVRRRWLLPSADLS
ncbi:glycosyltransferase family 2 protein [bacterium]|nr:glycosyltransferase family 2 protein [bacterium]